MTKQNYLFLAVQHERAPRTAQQSNYHHYPLTLTSRIRTAASTMPQPPSNASIFTTGLPFNNHPIIDPTSIIQQSTSTTTIHPHTYIPHGFLYQGMMTSFAKPLLPSTSASLNYYHKALYATNNSISNKSSPSPSTSSDKNMTSIMKDDEVSSSEEASSSSNNHNNTRMINNVSNKDDDDDNKKDKFEYTSMIMNEQNKRHMEIPTLTLFPADNTYESAAKLLFLAIKWAKSIPSFLQVRNSS